MEFAFIRLLIFAVEIVLFVLIVRLICQYQAKKNASAFEYEYLAQCVAEELRKEKTAQNELIFSQNAQRENVAARDV